MTMHARFPSPYDLKAPPAPRAGRSFTPTTASSRTSWTRKKAKFWFCDSQHWPTPFKPFEPSTVEFAVKCLGQYNTRH